MERKNSIRLFEITSSDTWSSIDGHGRVYHVHVTRTTSGETVEEIRAQDANTICIQYANIKQQ